MLKKTTNEFIQEAKIVHGNTYDYSKVEYKNARTKVIIICPKHGEFLQNPFSHLSGKGCPLCKGGIKSNKEDFIDKANAVHNYKYNYNKVIYKNSKKKVIITCPKHGDFWQSPDNHLHGSGCPKCRHPKKKLKRLNTAIFIKRSKQVHGNKYDYSKVVCENSSNKVEIVCPIHGSFWQRPFSHFYGKGCSKCSNRLQRNITDFIAKANTIHNNLYDYNLAIYVSNKIPIKIICPIHGVFEQRPSAHLKGQGCPKCGVESKKLSREEFISRANKIHNSKYNYSKVKILGTRNKIEIVCPEHGSFWQRMDQHLAGTGCPICSDSKGEIFIYHYLKDNNIPFIPQYKFKDCKNKKPLPFDFAIFNEDGSLRCLIEYQGKQHFEPNEFFGGKKGFEYILKTDIIKVDYCKNNKILLYHINYFDNLEEKLNQILKHF